MKIHFIPCILALALMLAFGSCQQVTDQKTNSGQVLATTNIIASSLKQVIGEELEVIALMNAETDPHSYEASPSDFQAVNSADVIVSNGLHLEGKFHETLVKAAKTNGTNLIMMSDGLNSSQIIFEDQTVADPHIWFNVMNWYGCLEYTVHKLAERYPEHKAKWETKLQETKTEYQKMDQYVKQSMQQIHDTSRYLVTAHDAFSYYAECYGIKILPLQGRNTTSEPSAKDAVELSNFIAEHYIKAIFVESTVNKKFIQSIQESVEEKGHSVQIGGQLYSDACGPEGTPEAAYLGMIKFNTDLITNALK